MCDNPKCDKEVALANQKAKYKWEKFAILDRLISIRKIETKSGTNRELYNLITKIRKGM